MNKFHFAIATTFLMFLSDPGTAWAGHPAGHAAPSAAQPIRRAAPPQSTERWIRELDDDDPQVRNQAEGKLRAILKDSPDAKRVGALAQRLEAVAASAGPEQKRRARRLIQEADARFMHPRLTADQIEILVGKVASWMPQGLNAAQTENEVASLNRTDKRRFLDALKTATGQPTTTAFDAISRLCKFQGKFGVTDDELGYLFKRLTGSAATGNPTERMKQIILFMAATEAGRAVLNTDKTSKDVVASLK